MQTQQGHADQLIGRFQAGSTCTQAVQNGGQGQAQAGQCSDISSPDNAIGASSAEQLHVHTPYTAVAPAREIAAPARHTEPAAKRQDEYRQDCTIAVRKDNGYMSCT